MMILSSSHQQEEPAHTAQTRRFDQECYIAALSYYGLPNQYRRIFKSIQRRDRTTHQPLTDETGKPLTMLISCNAQMESVAGNAVWVQVNLPFADAALNAKGFPKKARNDEIEAIQNISLDFEYPAAPELAHEIGQQLASFLAYQGMALPGLPVEDSGAGCHLVLPIVPITTTRETAPQWNDAVATVVRRTIKPEFVRLVERMGIAMDIGGFDISRVLSLPGTWRPYNSQKQDCSALRQGYLRRWLTPYINGCTPQRVESLILSQRIRDAFGELLHPRKTFSFSPRRPSMPRGAASSPERWLSDYARNRPTTDRSASFQTLVNAAYLKYGETTVLQLKDTIHQLSGEKYAGRLEVELQRSLSVAKQQPKTTEYAPGRGR